MRHELAGQARGHPEVVSAYLAAAGEISCGLFKVGCHPCRAKDFTDEFTRGSVIVHDKDLCRQSEAPMAIAIGLRLRYGCKVKNLFATLRILQAAV